MARISKSSSFLFVVALFFSAITLPCTESCSTCTPTKTPPPPPPSSTTPCPPPPPKKSPPSVSPPSVSPPSAQSCPIDTLKLATCADLLGLAEVLIGSSSGSKCCTLLNGLADLDAAVCLCTALKANVLGLKLDVPVSLTVLLNACKKTQPSGYICK